MTNQSVDGEPTDRDGEDIYGFGGISIDAKSSSNISNTLVIVGRFKGLVWMHHNPTMIVFLSSLSYYFLHRSQSRAVQVMAGSL
ncbi:hypothetical protein Tco_1060905, partial [Tanacetum coccineum]